MIAAFIVVAGMAGASGASAGPATPLEKCRQLDKEFDTKNMPKPCQAAVDDATLSIPERVEALRRLAFAHILNGDEALAEPAFLKMLVFSPSTELPADAGPRFRDIFAQVRKRFEKEGALTVSYTPPAPPKPGERAQVQVDIGDRLGRVVGARIEAKAAGSDAPLVEKMVRNELGPGQLRFSGAVPEPQDLAPGATVSFSVVFEGWDGKPVPPPAPVEGSYTREGGVASSDEGFPWAWVGAGSAAGVAVVGGAVGGIVWCYTAGPCRTQEAWVRVQIHQSAAGVTP